MLEFNNLVILDTYLLHTLILNFAHHSMTSIRCLLFCTSEHIFLPNRTFILNFIGALLLIMVSTSLPSVSQSPRRYYHIANGWTDVNISGKIAGKFSWQLENQHRRQDMQGEYKSETTTGNPYNNLNQHVFRPFIHYQLNPNVRFSLMPFGWIGSNRFAEGKPFAFFSELRVSPQVILTQNLGRLRVDHRFRYEFRWLGKNQDLNDKSFVYGGDYSETNYRERFRYQAKLTLPLNKAQMGDKTLYAQAYNELFLNTGKNISNLNLFDQNRVLIGFGYRLNHHYSVEASYMQQTIFRFNNTDKNNVDLNNILQLNFVLSNVESLFKKTAAH